MKMKSTIVKQVKEPTTPFQPDLFKPNTEADVVFSSSPDIAVECHKYGIVYSSRSPNPSQCCTTVLRYVAVVREKSSALMEVISYNGGPCEEPIQSMQCELVSELTGVTVRGSLERRGQSQYEISYAPAHHQGEAPTPHQNGGPAHQRESISCSSEVIYREDRHSNRT